VTDFRDWPFSSYHTLLSDKPSLLEKNAIIDWFGNEDAFRSFHHKETDEKMIEIFLFDE